MAQPNGRLTEPELVVVTPQLVLDDMGNDDRSSSEYESGTSDAEEDDPGM